MSGSVLLVGAGRLGSSIVRGWRKSGALPFADLRISETALSAEAEAAAREGARLNPASVDDVRTLVLAVKPNAWRSAAAACQTIAPDAVVLSVMAGVREADLSDAFSGRPVVRVMPTTSVAAAAGVASIHSEHEGARARAHALFDPIATTVDLPSEALMDAATAVSGSGPAYVYAFAAALEAAGRDVGLPAEAARILARATVASAANWLMESAAEPADLIAQVASPGGTTEAALRVLTGSGALDALLREAVAAAVKRAEELAG
jgi:pyrroline-5-carboxylate reductase